MGGRSPSGVESPAHAWIACVLATVLLLLFAPSVRAQSEARLAPPHSDSVLDIDGDGLNDTLRVTVSVDATTPGLFRVVVRLYDGANLTYITSSGVDTPLSGPSMVPVDLDGVDIRNAMIDGPFVAQLMVWDDALNLDAWGAHTTQSHGWADFDPASLTFTPPHWDEAIDTNGNTYFDVLRVRFNVSVSDPGSYFVTADLLDFSANQIAYTSSNVILGSGPQTVVVDFAGFSVRLHGVDGPYQVSLTVFGPNFGESETHVTGAYQATQFEPPPARLTAPHADSGIDRDGDGTFDEIAINVSLVVDVAGEYYISTRLYDGGLLGWKSVDRAFSVGSHTVQFAFSTMAMVAQADDGPYNVVIDLEAPFGASLGQDRHTTAAYTVSQFDPLPGAFGAPHADRGIDRDVPPDGEYNVLAVDATVVVTEARTFVVQGELWDLAHTIQLGSDDSAATLAPGTRTITLTFPGVPIRNSGINDRYAVLLRLFAIADGSFLEIDYAVHTTASYSAAQFQNVVPETLTGVLRDRATGVGVPSAWVDAFDHRNEMRVLSFTSGSGGYSLPLYDGDWVLIFDDFAHSSELRRITVSGSTIVDASLASSQPDPVSVDVSLPTWNSVRIVGKEVLADDNRTLRLSTDWQWGNRDQVLSQQEWDLVLAISGFTDSGGPADTSRVLRIDGSRLDLVPGSHSFAYANLTGPIDIVAPPELVEDDSFVNASIPSSVSHAIDLNVSYDSPYWAVTASVRLPVGFTLESYTAPTGVTVTGVGDGAAFIDPGPDPDPTDGVVWASVRLVGRSSDATPPLVTSATASPDPVDVNQPLTISATVIDASGVASVVVQAWDPTGALVANATMTNEGGGMYSYGLVPTRAGTYAFRVTATDLAGNEAHRDGSFLAREHNPPTIASAAATPNPQEIGLSVLLAADVSDDTAVASVTVEIFDPSHVSVGNFTMAFNPSSGRYELSSDFSGVGVYTFAVWAVDGSGNGALASGTFVMRDTTNPAADAGLDRTASAGTLVTFDATGSTDNDRIATFSWAFTEGGQSVTLAGAASAHRFDTPGTYVVTLTVTDPSGNEARDIVTITIVGDGNIAGLPAWGWALAVGSIAAVVALLIMIRARRGKKGKASAPSDPSSRATATVSDDRVAKLREAYQAGRIPQDLYERNLRALGAPPAAGASAVAASPFAVAAKVREAYRAGRLSRELYERNVRALGLEPDSVEDL